MKTWRAREKQPIKRGKQKQSERNSKKRKKKTRERNHGRARIAVRGKVKRQLEKKAGARRLRAYVVIGTNTGLGFAAGTRLSFRWGLRNEGGAGRKEIGWTRPGRPKALFARLSHLHIFTLYKHRLAPHFARISFPSYRNVARQPCHAHCRMGNTRLSTHASHACSR